MKKRWISGMLIVICLLLEGCGVYGENTDDFRQKLQSEDIVEKSASKDAGSENEAEQAAEDVNKKEIPSDTVSDKMSEVSCMTAYQRFLEAYVEENEFANMARAMLAWIDDDMVPELLLIEDNSHPSGVKVYTYDQESVVELGEFGSMGMMKYVERGGMILSSYTGMGESHAIFFQVAGREAKQVCWMISYQPFDGSPEENEIDGVRVTDEEYHKKWQELYDIDKYIVIGYNDAFSITESEIEDVLAKAWEGLH